MVIYVHEEILMYQGAKSCTAIVRLQLQLNTLLLLNMSTLHIKVI